MISRRFYGNRGGHIRDGKLASTGTSSQKGNSSSMNLHILLAILREFASFNLINSMSAASLQAKPYRDIAS